MDYNNPPRRSAAGNSDEQATARSDRTQLRTTAGAALRSAPDVVQDRRAGRIAAAQRSLQEVEIRLRSMGVDPDQVRTAFAIAHDCIAEAMEVSAQAQRELNIAHYEWDQAKRRRRNLSRYTDTAAPVVPDIPGVNLCPDPSNARTVADYMETLRMYRIWAGKPSYRVMEHQCGRRFAASTIYSALNGRGLPSLDMIQAVITACGGTDEHRQAFATALRRLTMSQQDTAHAPRHRGLYPISGTA
jgi:hypothetical protein